MDYLQECCICQEPLESPSYNSAKQAVCRECNDRYRSEVSYLQSGLLIRSSIGALMAVLAVFGVFAVVKLFAGG